MNNLAHNKPIKQKTTRWYTLPICFLCVDHEEAFNLVEQQCRFKLIKVRWNQRAYQDFLRGSMETPRQCSNYTDKQNQQREYDKELHH